MSPLRLLLASSLAAVLAACATLGEQQPFEAHLGSQAAAVRECAEWYRALDGAVEAAGVRDAQYARLPGFPYLRVDRPHASLRDRAAKSEAALQLFAERLLELDIESRRYEIDNLPAPDFEALPGVGRDMSRSVALQRTSGCGKLLRETDLANPAARAALLASAQVPDDYSAASRALGLYPLTRLPFASGVRRAEAESVAAFSRAPQTQADTMRVRFAPPPAPSQMTRAAVAALLGRAELDALGQPDLSERELARIAAVYAPSFEIAVSGDYDRFGQLRWRRGAPTPEVDAAAATAYVQQSFTRYREQSPNDSERRPNGREPGANGRDRILLQLVYTIWFPERPPLENADLLAGKLDGLVWRVTLAPDGEPLLYDSIHPCGCYHQFFPTPRARARPAPDALEEWAFVPLSLPRVGEDERPVVRLASRTHFIEGVSFARGADSVARYAFQDYDRLRSLPLPEGGRRSIFGADGLVAGTERGERFLFWPMGIRSAGAMRQWGRQATAFVGRRHFDDADLIERRFELDLADPGQADSAAAFAKEGAQ
jgi:hypothetical protein